MRFMVLIKGDKNTEAGVMPTQDILEKMGKFNEELVNAKVMLAGDGLHPSSKGARVKFKGGKMSVTDGPFTEAKELVAGFWIWQVKSKADAVAWLEKSPFQDVDVELRQIFEAEDFGAELTPELRANGERLAKEVEKLNRKG